MYDMPSVTYEAHIKSGAIHERRDFLGNPIVGWMR